MLKFKKRTNAFIPLSRSFTDAEQRVADILKSTENSSAVLAVKYDCSEQTIRNIKYLATARARKVRDILLAQGESFVTWSPAERFTDEAVAFIRKSPLSSRRLAKDLDVSPSTIRMIRTGQTYRGS